jgi:hypothetical protein
MEQSHVAMYRRLLESIAHYSQKMLERLEYGAGDLPQWTNDLISESRTHIADVTHFLRGQSSQGIRYGQAKHGRAYMATANLRQIHEYANECLSLMQKGAGHFPAWVENKISVVAEYMDLIGHWLENEGVEGRKYGHRAPGSPLPGDAGDEAFYRGRADGITGVHRNPYSPNDFRRGVYEQGFQYSYGNRSFAEPPRPARGDGMGRGRGRRRRHRRHGVHLFPYWNVPHHERSYSQTRPSGEPDRPRPDRPRPGIPATTARPLPPATPDPSEPVPADLHPAGIPGKPGVVYQPGYGSRMALGPAPTTPENMAPSQMEQTMPPSRMLEAHRQGLQHRQLWQQTGRRFGVPGFAPGEPGWAGAGGVAQIPRPNRGLRRASNRSFGPGFSAGQGGVQTWPVGGGPMAVQTYGSLGYASMGDGSMDMAARGSIRRYSGGGSVSLKKPKVGPRAARRSRKRR